MADKQVLLKVRNRLDGLSLLVLCASRSLCEALAYHVLEEINRVSSVTPTALVLVLHQEGSSMRDM